MIKTTNYYIVVFIAFVFLHSSAFAQYNGGSGDGANTDMLSLTSCVTPPHFYAYFGGSGDAAALDQLNQTACSTPSTFYAYFGGTGDGAHTDMLTNTTCGTPAVFFPYMGGIADGASTDLLNQTTCANPPQFYAYMGGNGDGSMNDMLTLTACSTPSQFYAYMGGQADGFSMNSVINCSSIPPVADFASNVTSVCAGGTVAFTDASTAGPTAWNWTFSGGTPATSTAQNPSVVYNTPGVYNVSLTAINPNGTDTKTITGYITVNAYPTANAGTDASVCTGSSTTLNASGGVLYSWNPTTGLSSSTISNPVANPTVNTTYTVTVTSSGCSSTDAVIVTVNPLPTVSVPSISICNGNAGTLTATGASTYAWSPATGLSSTTGNSVSASPAANTTYTITGTSSAGCVNTATSTVTVNPVPVADAGTDVTICNGTSATLSASGGGTYSWSPATGLSSTTISNPVSSTTVTRTYTVTVTNGSGCTSTDAVTVTVTPLPPANAGTDVTICNGSSTTLSASGGTSYSWSPATSLSSATISNPVASPTVSTTYTVTVSASGCSKTDAVVVTVVAPPTANAGNDATICNGSSTSLSASGGTFYSWSPSAGLSSTTISNPVASPTITTTYTVSVSSGGCTSTDAVQVSVNSLPVADAGTDVTICNGTSTSLSGNGGISYTWSPSSGLSSATVSNPVASPATTVNYTLTVTDVNGCQSSDAVLVSVTPLPVADAGLDVTICTGSSTTLSASGGTGYSWSPGTGLSSTSIVNPIANPAATTNYTVTVTNSGCTATDVVTVSVNSSLTADAGSDVSICNGSSTTLSASGGASYSWSPATGLSFSNIANPVANPSVTTTYTVTVSSGGCSATDAVVVTVNPVPLASISTSGSTTFCAGDSVILTANAGSSYLWSNSAITQAITVTASGNFSVSITNTFGCSATSAITSVTVNPAGIANITASGPTTFCQGDSVILTANTGNSYSWSTGATTQSITVAAGGIYTITVADINGCSSPSASATITVNPNPAIPVITSNGSTSLCLGDSVILISDAANSYLWNTGSTDSAIIITTAGVYSVTNYNSFGCGTTSAAINVSVNDPLVDFIATPLLVFIPTANVSFSATPNGVPPYTYLWNFGDATTSTLSAPSHTYGTVAYQTVSLILTDSTGCSKTITKPNYVEVEQLFPSYAMNTGTSLDLTGVSFLDAQTGIMSLTDGNCLISLDSGNNWSPLPTGNTQPLTGVRIRPADWFATGMNGTILHSINNGASWTPFSTGTTETFNSSSFSSATNGFAVGTNGTIQKYDGSAWTPETSGTVNHLNNVFALSSGEAIAVGDNQTILKYNGVSWLPQTSPVSFNAKDIRFSSLLEGYAAGTNGVIIKTTDGGATWTPSLTGVDIDFNSVEVSGTDSAWACGTNGIVYTTVDDGATWIRYSVGYTAEQKEIRVNNGKGHVVGAGGHGRNFGNYSAVALGINNTLQTEADNFNVYPNPARDNFSISALITDNEDLNIDIRDAEGKLLKNIVSTKVSGTFNTIVSTENYRQGVYFIHVKAGEKSWVKKLIITK